MKIREWEELDGLQHNDLALSVLRGCCGIRIIIFKYNDYMPVEINTSATNEQRLAILKVFGFDVEFVEPPKLTKRERALCEYLPADWWIARDKGRNNLFAYEVKPFKNGAYWSCCKNLMYLDWCKFDFIKWEDAEPYQVSDLLKLEVGE